MTVGEDLVQYRKRKKALLNSSLCFFNGKTIINGLPESFGSFFSWCNIVYALIEKSIILLYAKDAALGSMIERRAPTLKSSWMFTNFMAQ